ncbi:cell division protein ZapA [Rapidithrix thailandica]|uniref:Cell division protein ZapA n=1 Tax=Rapidithrix thailandica TaxID=413964 RepID=A0AAW9S094_9BACT
MRDFYIKIKILDREYSLKIDPKDEAVLRKAGKFLDEQLNERKQQSGIASKQDLLAMIAFDHIVNQMKNEEGQQFLAERLQQCNHWIDEVIK